MASTPEGHGKTAVGRAEGHRTAAALHPQKLWRLDSEAALNCEEKNPGLKVPTTPLESADAAPVSLSTPATRDRALLGPGEFCLDPIRPREHSCDHARKSERKFYAPLFAYQSVPRQLADQKALQLTAQPAA